MRKPARQDDTVNNIDDLALAREDDTPLQTPMIIVLPDLDSHRTYKVLSPRLARPEDGKDFLKQVVEDVDADTS